MSDGNKPGRSRCVECSKASLDSNAWSPGEVCLFGMLFACSIACAEKWARENAAEGSRPGEPGFFMDVEPDKQCND